MIVIKTNLLLDFIIVFKNFDIFLNFIVISSLLASFISFLYSIYNICYTIINSGHIMSWIARVYNSYPVKTIHTATFFYGMYEAYNNRNSVIPSMRIAKFITQIAMRCIFKGLPPIK